MERQVWLLCRQCVKEESFEKGSSEVGVMPEMAKDRLTTEGPFYDFAKEHHGELHGYHNVFDVIDNDSGEIVGRASIGSQTGYAFVEFESRSKEGDY